MASQAWENFEKYELGTALYVKKNPDRVIQNIEYTNTEKSLINAPSHTSYLRDYALETYAMYKKWNREMGCAKTMQHFETHLLVITSPLLEQYIRAAIHDKQYKKGVEMYEKYRSLFPNYCSVNAVICFFKIGNIDRALLEFEKAEPIVDAIKLHLLFRQSPPLLLVERIVDNPKLSHLLSLRKIELYSKITKGSPSLNLKFLKLMIGAKIQEVIPQISYYSDLHDSYDHLLKEYKKDPSKVFINLFVDIIKKFIANKESFMYIVPSYILKSQKVLSSVDFHELLYNICLALTQNKMWKEAVDIICQYCDQDNIHTQKQLFISFCRYLVQYSSFEESKEAIDILQLFIDKFGFLHHIHQEDSIHKPLFFYYVMRRDYLKALNEKPYITFNDYSSVLDFFFKENQYEAVVFIFETLSPKFVNTILPFQFIKYSKSLVLLHKYWAMIDYWKRSKDELSIDLPMQSKLYALYAAVKLNDMKTFATIFEEVKQCKPDKVYTPTIDHVTKGLKEKGYELWILRLYEEIVSQHRLSHPLPENCQETIQQVQLKYKQKNPKKFI